MKTVTVALIVGFLGLPSAFAGKQLPSLANFKKAFGEAPGGSRGLRWQTRVRMPGVKGLVTLKMAVQRDNGSYRFNLQVPQGVSPAAIKAKFLDESGYPALLLRDGGHVLAVQGYRAVKIADKALRDLPQVWAEISLTLRKGKQEGFYIADIKNPSNDRMAWSGTLDTKGLDPEHSAWGRIFSRMFDEVVAQPSFTYGDIGVSQLPVIGQ